MKVVPIRKPMPEVPEDARDVAPGTRAALDDDGPKRYDRITVRAITVAIVLSLFIHFAVIFIPFLQRNEEPLRTPAEEQGPLSVTIEQAKPPPQARAAEPAPQPTPEAQKPQPPKATVRPRPVPPRQTPQLAINKPSTGFVVPPPAPAPVPVPEIAPPPAPTEDFSATIAARQRARRAQNGGAPDEVLESDDDRAKRIAMANVTAQQRSASPDQDPNAGGGLFQLQRVGPNEAQYLFRGWNKSFRRNWSQQVEVRQGNDPDIRIAVIRSMINIIREQKPGDFEWQSHRLGKVITMSARPKDQAQLETFLMREFFPDDARAR